MKYAVKTPTYCIYKCFVAALSILLLRNTKFFFSHCKSNQKDCQPLEEFIFYHILSFLLKQMFCERLAVHQGYHYPHFCGHKTSSSCFLQTVPVISVVIVSHILIRLFLEYKIKILLLWKDKYCHSHQSFCLN